MKKITLLTLLAFCISAHAAEAVFHKNKLAMQGYDLVAYHTKDKAMLGKEKFTVNHQEINYRFTSKKNAKLFTETPQKYVPLYGGWCAWAMMEDGSFVKSNPKAYKLVKDEHGNVQLLFFYKNFVVDTLQKWNEKLKASQKTNQDFIQTANTYWEKHFPKK